MSTSFSSKSSRRMWDNFLADSDEFLQMLSHLLLLLLLLLMKLMLFMLFSEMLFLNVAVAICCCFWFCCCHCCVSLCFCFDTNAASALGAAHVASASRWSKVDVVAVVDNADVVVVAVADVVVVAAAVAVHQQIGSSSSSPRAVDCHQRFFSSVPQNIFIF